eukprot:5414184-Ditylum_brightwellii.AAC.1
MSDDHRATTMASGMLKRYTQEQHSQAHQHPFVCNRMREGYGFHPSDNNKTTVASAKALIPSFNFCVGYPLWNT